MHDSAFTAIRFFVHSVLPTVWNEHTATLLLPRARHLRYSNFEKLMRIECTSRHSTTVVYHKFRRLAGCLLPREWRRGPCWFPVNIEHFKSLSSTTTLSDRTENLSASHSQLEVQLRLKMYSLTLAVLFVLFTSAREQHTVSLVVM